MKHTYDIDGVAMRGGKRVWTAAEDERLRLEYPDAVTAALAAAMGRTHKAVYARAKLLGLHKSAAYLSSAAACRLATGTTAGAAFRFKPGQVPANKGLRRPGWTRGRMQDTQFRKGDRNGVALRLYKPIGTERVSRDGYRERKVNDDLPLQKRWRAVHLLLWEAAHGPLPKGYAVAFKNGDKADIRLDNLELITRGELMRRNTIHNLPAPLVETIQLLGALKRQIRRRSRAHAEEPHR